MKGLHWGNIDINDKSVIFNVADRENVKQLFTIPFSAINSASVNKNDIILEIKDLTDAKPDKKQEDLLCEIRFFVDTPKVQQSLAEENEQAEKKQTYSHAETLHQQIVEKGNIGMASGESIATLNEISLGVPRGKYTIDFYQHNMRFHGSTFNYNVDYKNIQKGFILPQNEESRIAIVVQLSKPIIQGQTVHPFIVIQISKEFQEKVTTNVKEEYLKDSPHLEKVKPEYSGQLENIVVDLLKSITNIDLIVPGENFKSHGGNPYIKCSRKTQSGFLYFLKKSMIFIMKPVIYFRVDDIEKAEFHRMGATNKQFDLKIVLKNKQSSQYASIDRSEFDSIQAYFKEKDVSFIKVGGQTQRVQMEAESESSQDQDFDGGNGEDSDDDDSQLVSQSEGK